MDRREFLGKSALALGAAFSLTSLATAAEAAPAVSAASAVSAAPAAACPVSGLEKWLLETGRAQMDHDDYAVACQSVR